MTLGWTCSSSSSRFKVQEGSEGSGEAEVGRRGLLSRGSSWNRASGIVSKASVHDSRVLRDLWQVPSSRQGLCLYRREFIDWIDHREGRAGRPASLESLFSVAEFRFCPEAVAWGASASPRRQGLGPPVSRLLLGLWLRLSRISWLSSCCG